MVKSFELIKYGKEKLINSNTPQLDAEVLLSHILHKDRIYLYMNRDIILEEAVVNRFYELIEKRLDGEPIAYITGVREFMGLSFKVAPGVLIPRADTEILVEEVIARLRCLEKPVIVDIGCGSGAISIALAKNIKESKVYALDIMDSPLRITADNAVSNGVSEQVEVIKSDLLRELSGSLKGRVDAIVSNPPYIEEEVIETLMPDVKNYEPISALYGGRDGLDFYRRITQEATEFLKDNGLLAYEIGYNQREMVCNIMQSHGFINVECIKDLGGNDRVVLGYFKN